MKRTLIIGMAFVLVACAQAAAQSITVTHPAANETWLKGSSYAITWTKQGQLAPTVTIQLRDVADTTTVLTIADFVSNSGSYQWSPVPASVAVGTYKIRVKALTVFGTSAAFTIAAQGQQGGGIHAQPGQATAAIELKILAPKSESVWTVGMPGTVQWQVGALVKYPLWLFLVSADHKVPIMDMGKIGGNGSYPTQMQWTVTDNIYDGQYCVRITSADNKYQVHSQAFKIVATTYRTVTAPVSEVGNQYKWHDWHSETNYNPAGGQPFTQGGPHLAPVPDPAGTVIKYGYQRWYDDDGNHGWILHRSFVRFNLSAIIASLKHKTVVKSVAITWGVAPGSPQTCDGAVLGLEAALPNLNAMFGDEFTNFPKRLLTPNGDPAAVNQLVQQWLDNPQKNYGTVFYGPNEGQLQENGQCVEFATNAVLKMQLEEKLTK